LEKEMCRDPAVRIRHRRNWSVPLVAAIVAVGAALLVLGLYYDSPARAQPRSPVLVGAGT
jgi:hypothetical protein